MFIRTLLLTLISLPCFAAESLIDTYIYGYPIVLMDVTKEVSTNVSQPGSYQAPINQFAHARELPGATFRLFPSPNVDMLSSRAWLDVTNNAYILHLPTIPNRYFVVEIIDGSTNVITSLGPRTTGSNAQDFLITGPSFSAEVPKNMTQIAATTSTIWIIARIQCYGPQDVSALASTQNLFTLTPLSSYGQYYSPPQNVPVNSAIDMKTPPVEQVANMDPKAFFARLSKLDTSVASVANEDPQTLKQAKDAALAKISAKLKDLPKALTGWSIPLTLVGDYGKDYLLRAATAQVALGANIPADILAIIATCDVTGEALDGKNSYRIHMSPSQVPPVNAFWSLTMYDNNHYLVPNSQNRYVLHSFTTLAYKPIRAFTRS